MTDVPNLTPQQQSILIALFKEGQLRKKRKTANIHPFRRQAKASRYTISAYSGHEGALLSLKEYGLVSLKGPDDGHYTVTLTKEGSEAGRMLTEFEKL